VTLSSMSRQRGLQLEACISEICWLLVFMTLQQLFFRVSPTVVQFGLSGVPSTNAKWSTPIQDDPNVQSNIAGTVAYAAGGPNTRTTQLFFNKVNNSRYDSMGFAPFGMIVEGMDVVNKLFNPTPMNPYGVDQDNYTTKGQDWIEQTYPGINSIIGAVIEDEEVTELQSQACPQVKHWCDHGGSNDKLCWGNCGEGGKDSHDCPSGRAMIFGCWKTCDTPAHIHRYAPDLCKDFPFTLL